MNFRIFNTLLLMLCLISLQSCAKKQTKRKSPACLTAKINEWKKQYCETGKTVKQYTFQGKTVYVFEPGSCGADMQTIVVDANCKELGALGGFNGNMKINGEDFSSAKYLKTIWSN